MVVATMRIGIAYKLLNARLPQPPMLAAAGNAKTVTFEGKGQDVSPGYFVVCSHRMTALGHFMARVRVAIRGQNRGTGGARKTSDRVEFTRNTEETRMRQMRIARSLRYCCQSLIFMTGASLLDREADSHSARWPPARGRRSSGRA